MMNAVFGVAERYGCHETASSKELPDSNPRREVSIWASVASALIGAVVSVKGVWLIFSNL